MTETVTSLPSVIASEKSTTSPLSSHIKTILETDQVDAEAQSGGTTVEHGGYVEDDEGVGEEGGLSATLEEDLTTTTITTTNDVRQNGGASVAGVGASDDVVDAVDGDVDGEGEDDEDEDEGEDTEDEGPGLAYLLQDPVPEQDDEDEGDDYDPTSATLATRLAEDDQLDAALVDLDQGSAEEAEGADVVGPTPSTATFADDEGMPTRKRRRVVKNT